MIATKSAWGVFLRRFNPAIPLTWLLAIAGLIWTGVGVMLCIYAFTWLTRPFSIVALALGLLGITISIAANRYQFSKLALKNIDRILVYPGRACVFAFQAWKGYAIIAIMVTGGILLRHSAIPRAILAVPYSAIGGALLLASGNYYVRLARMILP